MLILFGYVLFSFDYVLFLFGYALFSFDYVLFSFSYALLSFDYVLFSFGYALFSFDYVGVQDRQELLVIERDYEMPVGKFTQEVLPQYH